VEGEEVAVVIVLVVEVADGTLMETTSVMNAAVGAIMQGIVGVMDAVVVEAIHAVVLAVLHALTDRVLHHVLALIVDQIPIQKILANRATRKPNLQEKTAATAVRTATLRATAMTNAMAELIRRHRSGDMPIHHHHPNAARNQSEDDPIRTDVVVAAEALVHQCHALDQAHAKINR